VIVDGENGLLFEPGDYKMLASKLSQLHGDRSLNRRLGAGAATSAADYDWSVIGERFRMSIRGLL
jgi:glycosyltransferase involved in cell wall biosynthesis